MLDPMRTALLCSLALACGAESEQQPDGGEEMCSALDSSTAATSATPPTQLVLPPAGGGFDYQLGCAYPVPEGVDVVTRDRTAPADPDVYSVCYVNAFQTQPGSDWSGPREDLVLHDAGDTKVRDPDWPDEYLLDISTPERRARLVQIVAPWIEQCAARGFDALELDNLDSYVRSGQRLTPEHAEAYAAELIRVAHDNLLSVAQKNAPDRTREFRAIGFDFVIAEDCWKYDECDQFTAEYGERVFDVEYDADAFDKGCRAGRQPSPILRDLDLVQPGDGYVRRECR